MIATLVIVVNLVVDLLYGVFESAHSPYEVKTMADIQNTVPRRSPRPAAAP